MIYKLGSPYSYGDELDFKTASNNRKQAVSYLVLISNSLWHNLKFAEPIQFYTSFSNYPKM